MGKKHYKTLDGNILHFKIPLVKSSQLYCQSNHATVTQHTEIAFLLYSNVQHYSNVTKFNTY